MKILFNVSIFLSFLLFMAACANNKENIDEAGEELVDANVVTNDELAEARLDDPNIYETVSSSSSLQLLADALRSTGLDTMLAQDGPYTLFAPSDEAFEAMRKYSENRLPDSINNEGLKELLLHHVARGSYSAADLANMSGVATLGGDSLKIEASEQQLTVDGASMVFSDPLKPYTDRSEGESYVHVIDSVLQPGS